MKQYTFLLLFVSTLSFGQITVLNEDFQNGIPSTWTIVNKDGLTPDPSVSNYTDAWIDIDDPYDDTAHVNKCAGATSFFTTSGSANRWLITPPITLAGFGNILEYRAASFDPSFPDNYVVKVGTDLNHLENFTTLVSYIAEPPYWSSHTMFFDTLGYNNQTVYVAFVLNSNDGNRLFLDDISFRVEDHLANQEIHQSPISIFPNPTSDFIFISSEKKNLQKSIFDMTGKQILETHDDKINVSELENGIYIIKLEGDNRTFKFVKQ